MRHNDLYDDFIKGFAEKGQYALSLHFQKQMILNEFAHSKEMQKIKEEITRDVMNSISVNIENKVRQVLDELFKELNL